MAQSNPRAKALQIALRRLRLDDTVSPAVVDLVLRLIPMSEPGQDGQVQALAEQVEGLSQRLNALELAGRLRPSS